MTDYASMKPQDQEDPGGASYDPLGGLGATLLGWAVVVSLALAPLTFIAPSVVLEVVGPANAHTIK